MISVIIPAYNAQDFIADAIESILAQTLTAFELIIVDDGSTDATLEIAQSYADRDARVSIINGNHSGVGAALNLGLQASRYPWVAIMHADDVALPERLETQLQMAQTDPEVVIWGTDGYHINSKGAVISRFRVGPLSKTECAERRTRGELVQAIHPTVLLNREVALRVGGYDPLFPVCEDIELFDRMMTHGMLVTIPKQLLHYRVHGRSLSMQKYMSQGIIARYVVARQKMRMEYGVELSYAKFMEDYSRRSYLIRLVDYLGDLRGMYYRRAGIAYSNGQILLMILYFTLSVLLDPFYALPRVWQQVVSPMSQRERNTLEAPEVV